MDNKKCTAYAGMDFGSVKGYAVPTEVVEVEISASDMLSDFARAFVSEAYRVNPGKAERVQLSKEELVSYANYLMTKRIDFVHDDCNDFRKLKALYIPSYIQYILSMIGIFEDRDYGLKFIPVAKERSEMTFEEAIAISEKIGSFIDDLQIVEDAMPRDISGDRDVMSSALIAGYVRSIRKDVHPSATYAVAFANMQLRKEAAFKTLYRIQYDDVSFIETVFASQKGLY